MNKAQRKSVEMKGSLQKALAERTNTIILDGGLATELERQGCDISSALWSAEVLIDKPEFIEQVHLDYFLAGADVAITASYQASTAGLMKHIPSITEPQAAALIEQSVRLAKNAAQTARESEVSRQLYVAGSVGPYGAFLADGSEYRGDYKLSADEMEDFHRPRVAALVNAGVDVLAFETIPSYDEAEALLGVLHEHPQMTAWFSFTLKDGDHISDGTALRQVALLLDHDKQVLAVGINCVSEDLVEDALKDLVNLTTKPLVVYPNSGEIYDATTKTWNGEQSRGLTLQEKARKWRKSGARLIGGCCRTSPDSIMAIRRALQ